jgi:hypothetical protein
MGLSCISLNTFFEHQRISNSFYSMLIPIWCDREWHSEFFLYIHLPGMIYCQQTSLE